MDDLLRYAPCGFLSFADNGAILQANATLATWLGREAAALVGLRFDQLLAVGGRLFYQTDLFPLLTLHGEVDEVALTLHAADGEGLPVLLSGARREREGQMITDCVMLVVRQRCRYEEALLLARRAAEEAHRTRVRADQALLELQKRESMGTLAGGVAQDFNNLLVVEAAAAPAAQATALVIDDEPALRAVVRRLLVRIGYGVVDAPGGQEGLDLLEKRPDISCVLLDLTMPGLSGEETLRRIRARRPSLPVVIMSGYTAQEIRERLDEPASVGVLEKPFRLADLRRVIGEMVTVEGPAPVATRTR